MKFIIPKIMDKITPRNIIIVCVTSVHITAFIPPYFYHSINLILSYFYIFNYIQYLYKVYK
jgi:hypothetical protein